MSDALLADWSIKLFDLSDLILQLFDVRNLSVSLFDLSNWILHLFGTCATGGAPPGKQAPVERSSPFGGEIPLLD